MFRLYVIIHATINKKGVVLLKKFKMWVARILVCGGWGVGLVLFSLSRLLIVLVSIICPARHQ